MNKKSSIVISSVAACAIFASAFAFNGFAIGNTKAESIAAQDTTNISQSTTAPSNALESIISKVAQTTAQNKDGSNTAAVNNVTANTSKSTNCPINNNVDTTTATNNYNQPTTATNNNIESAGIINKLQTIAYTKNCNNSTAKNTNYSNIQSALNSFFKSGSSVAKPAASKPSASKPATQKPASTPAVSGDYAAFQKRVVELVNAERAKNGLKPLTMNAQVNKTATLKSQDMAKLGYFDHNSPTYGSPFDMMKKYGISYRTAGENIAMGQTTPEQVMKGWMNSPGHRANILKASFTQIGVGVAKNSSGRLYWTQQFIG